MLNDLKRRLARDRPWLTELAYSVRGRVDARFRRQWLEEQAAERDLLAQLPQAFPATAQPRRVLAMGSTRVAGVAHESVVMKGFEAAGYQPIVFAPRQPPIRRLHNRLGIHGLASLEFNVTCE